MARWRFYQGLRTEWRWYRVDDGGDVVAESDRGYAELQGCMANAETAGFTGEAFQVYARQADSFVQQRAATALDSGSDELMTRSAHAAGADEQAAP